MLTVYARQNATLPASTSRSSKPLPVPLSNWYVCLVTGQVERVGNTVRRPMDYWSLAVHDLLRFLESADFPAPRVLRAEDGVETVSWIDGESGPGGWAKFVPEAGLRRWARFLRSYHDAVAGYRPPADSVWSSGTGSRAAGEIICHGDYGPWNGIWRGDNVVGLIDWDHARPAKPLFDVAYGLEYAAPFRDDSECVRWLRHPGPPDRRRRIEVFCDATACQPPTMSALAWRGSSAWPPPAARPSPSAAPSRRQPGSGTAT
jgi:hypothetical protein